MSEKKMGVCTGAKPSPASRSLQNGLDQSRAELCTCTRLHVRKGENHVNRIKGLLHPRRWRRHVEP
jgi:hypothetical protein